MIDVRALLDRLWDGYVEVTPQAGRVHAWLEARGETVRNDHVALRTFDDPRVGLDVVARPFARLGFAPKDEYDFPQKKLRARYYQHPDESLPKIFVSELRLAELSDEARAIVDRLLAQVPEGTTEREGWPAVGRPWSPTGAEHDRLLEESEYAAWLAAFGFRANHFTVDVGALRTFTGIAEVNDFLRAQGLSLNDAGGAIKGSPEALLEQSSTRADRVRVELADGPRELPSCYYEFARRYAGPDGRVFQGFVPASADRLFESTDAR